MEGNPSYLPGVRLAALSPLGKVGVHLPRTREALASIERESTEPVETRDQWISPIACFIQSPDGIKRGEGVRHTNMQLRGDFETG